MKRILSALLILCVVLTLSACAWKGKTTDAPSAATTEEGAAVSDQTKTQSQTQPQSIQPGTVTPGQAANAARETTLTPSAVSQTTAAPRPQEYSHTVTDGTVSFRYAPLDKSTDGDLCAACIRACAALDARYRQSGTADTDEIRDRRDYTHAHIDNAFTDGETGAAYAFLNVRFVDDEEPDSWRPEYHYVLRTKDFGKTWEKSTNAFCCFFDGHSPAFASEGRLYLFAYSETGIQEVCLISDDSFDTCRILTDTLTFTDLGYIREAKPDSAGNRLILTVRSTMNGFILSDDQTVVPGFVPEYYEVVTDRDLNVISTRRTS